MTAEDRARRAARALRRTPVGDPPPIEQLRRRRTRRRLAAAGTAVVLLVGGVTWAASGDGDDGAAPVVAGPSETETDGTTTEVSGNPRPTSFLAVREDGTLVMAADGEPTVVASHGDPREKPAEGTSQFIADVTWDDVQELAYYESCCEPAGGAIFRTVVETGAEERIADGYHPSVRSRRLVFSTYTGISIIDLDTGDRHDIAGNEGYTPGSGVVDMSADTRTVAMEETTWPEGRSRILLVDAGAASLDEATALEPPAGRSWTLPVFQRDGNLLVVEQCCWPDPTGTAIAVVVDPATGEEVHRFQFEGPVLDQAYDDTGTWLIYVTADHVLRWRGADERGTLGEGYRTADW